MAEVKVTKNANVLVFSDGETTREYDTTKLPADIKDRLMYHGLIQKLRDSYSGYKKKGIDWHSASDAVWDALCSGIWERKPESKLKKLEKLAENGTFNKKQIALLKKLGLLK